MKNAFDIHVQLLLKLGPKDFIRINITVCVASALISVSLGLELVGGENSLP